MIMQPANFGSDWLIITGLILLPVFLYAEMHFRLPFMKGVLYRRQPEILFDLPYRSETGIVPVLLLIKDAHWFPIVIESLEIRLRFRGNKKTVKSIPITLQKTVDTKWFHQTVEIDASDYTNHWVQVDCFLTVRNRKKTVVIRNDNYRTLSQKSFEIFIDPEPLPSEDGWVWGDLHAHSYFTEDQVEFGPPPECYRSMGRALGLSFCALTDHSYDLDDRPDSWTRNDPELQKWNQFRQTIETLNRDQNQFMYIPGEEISVDNGFGRNVHMVVLNDPDFHYGSGDSMEESLGRTAESHYARILEKLPKNALAFAAHPFEKPPISHRLILQRGTWNPWDLHPRLDGFQIMNGKAGNDFRKGKNHWINQLLSGYQPRIYAGNDSHGNFNRFRQIQIPLLRMHEHPHQIFGANLTAVKTSPELNLNSLIRDLKKSSVIISNGPFIHLSIGDERELALTAKSSRFFGRIKEITIYRGDFTSSKESLFYQTDFKTESFRSVIQRSIPADLKPAYFRAEIRTDKERFALTNSVSFS